MDRFQVMAGAALMLASGVFAQAGGNDTELQVVRKKPAPDPIVLTVDPDVEIGKIKIMNAVNNGPAIPPVSGNQARGNFNAYKAARIPYARLHDSINCVSGGAHCVDISAIFPDFEADENDPASYDFCFTDKYLDAIRKAGTGIFFRLGQTIEHGPKKYGVIPPKDYAKWARICEHVIRHYNEGWADGYKWNIVYWEIWNEPDLDCEKERWKKDPRCWGGPEEEFFKFYATAAKHLKGCFPHLKIGGPGNAGRFDWARRFFKHMKENDVPIDFFSWHIYSNLSINIANKCLKARKLMDECGYPEAENILNEWNYVEGWTDQWVYSLRVESGDLNLKGAAFVASVMNASQLEPVDMLMYYDARVGTVMNGMFDHTTLWPKKCYYTFYAWSKLLDRGTQVKAEITGAKPDQYGDINFRATAAKGADGSLALFVSRYHIHEIGATVGPKKVRIVVPGYDAAKSVCHLTDMPRTYTEVPLPVNSDGSLDLEMQTWSFALLEFYR